VLLCLRDLKVEARLALELLGDVPLPADPLDPAPLLGLLLAVVSFGRLFSSLVSMSSCVLRLPRQLSAWRMDSRSSAFARARSESEQLCVWLSLFKTPHSRAILATSPLGRSVSCSSRTSCDRPSFPASASHRPDSPLSASFWPVTRASSPSCASRLVPRERRPPYEVFPREGRPPAVQHLEDACSAQALRLRRRGLELAVRAVESVAESEQAAAQLELEAIAQILVLRVQGRDASADDVGGVPGVY